MKNNLIDHYVKAFYALKEELKAQTDAYTRNGDKLTYKEAKKYINRIKVLRMGINSAQSKLTASQLATGIPSSNKFAPTYEFIREIELLKIKIKCGWLRFFRQKYYAWLTKDNKFSIEAELTRQERLSNLKNKSQLD